MARERRFDASRRAREGERDGDERGARREICVERRRRAARGDGARGGDGEDEGCGGRRRPGGGASRALGGGGRELVGRRRRGAIGGRCASVDRAHACGEKA